VCLCISFRNYSFRNPEVTGKQGNGCNQLCFFKRLERSEKKWLEEENRQQGYWVELRMIFRRGGGNSMEPAVQSKALAE
jgi:hypothetical protein